MPRRFPKDVEHVLVPFGNASAFVLDPHDQALAACMRSEDHGPAGWRILERIVQQVHHRGGATQAGAAICFNICSKAA